MKNENMERKRIIVSIIVLSVVGLLSIAVPIILQKLYPDFAANDKVLFVSGLVFLVTAFLVSVVNFISSASEKDRLNIGKQVSDLVYSQFNKSIQLPMVICDEKGKIVWYNDIIKDKYARVQEGNLSKGTLYNKYLDTICDATLSKISNGNPEEGVEVHFNDETMGENAASDTYLARECKVDTAGKQYHALIFTNISELKSAYATIKDNDTIIACAIIDNLDELVQYVQDLYRDAVEEVENILKKHMEAVGGVLRDYGHNRFLLIFRAEDLAAFEQAKFPILDEVRNIYLGDTTIPVTISIGVAKIHGTLAEKEKIAQTALDMALQRGGDQVAVKTESKIDYYGGRVSSLPKRAKVRSRVLANEFNALIKESSNVLVMGHSMADFDALASCLGVARIAKAAGVPVNVICDVNDKNLAHCFEALRNSEESYDGLFVDKLEAQNLITSTTLAVVVDVNNLDYSEAPEIIKVAKNYVIIDHHRQVSELEIKPAITYIEVSASSSSEQISEFLEQLLPQGTLPKAEADLLYAGIMLDTKHFTHNVGVRTFGAALYLRGENANPLDAESLFKVSLNDFMTEAKFESNVIMYRSSIAIAYYDQDTKSPLIRINASKSADRLLGVEGVHASFALCSSNGVVFISARSDGSVNVQLVMEKLGGGGHFDAAGVQLRNTSVNDAVLQLRGAIDGYFDSLSVPDSAKGNEE